MSQDIPEFMTPTANQKNNDRPLSPNGRFNRLSYLAWSSLFNMGIIICLYLLALLFGTSGDDFFNVFEQFYTLQNFSIFILAMVLTCANIYFQIVVVIRRLHDLNMSGWLSLLFLIPLIQYLFVLYLICMPGTKDSNDYGLPRSSRLWEKILGWLTIVLSLGCFYAFYFFWRGLH